MKLIIPGRPKHERRDVHLFDGCVITFHMGNHAGAQCSISDEVSPGHPQYGLIVSRAQQLGWNVVDDIVPLPAYPVSPTAGSPGIGVHVLALGDAGALITSTPAAGTPAPKPAPGSASSLVQDRILRNGWRTEDLEGLSLDPASPTQTPSITTGLSAIEMMTTTAPPGWVEAAASAFPWQLDGWRPPSDEWTTPPHARSKLPEPAQGEAPVAPVEAPEIVEPVAPTPTTDTPTITIPKVTGEHPAVLAGYGDVATVEKAVAVIAELCTVGPGGKIQKPGVAKASSNLRARGLKACNATELSHLCTGLT